MDLMHPGRLTVLKTGDRVKLNPKFPYPNYLLCLGKTYTIDMMCEDAGVVTLVETGKKVTFNVNCFIVVKEK